MSYVIDRERVPHLRCGICDLPLDDDDATVYVDDERCHVSCPSEAQLASIPCPNCGGELPSDWRELGICEACGVLLG